MNSDPSTSPIPSRQTRQEKRKRLRWGLIALIAVPVLLIALLLGLWIGVTSYLRSDDFRNLVNRETNDALKADGSYEKFTWTGMSVYSAGYTAVGREDGYFESLAGATIRADIDLDGVKRGYWTISNLEIGKLDLRLGNPSDDKGSTELEPTSPAPISAETVVPPTGAEAQPDLASENAAENPSSQVAEPIVAETRPQADLTPKTKEEKPKNEKEKGDFLTGWLPSDLELKRVAVRDASVQWAPSAQQAGLLSNTQMTLVPTSSTDLEQGWDVKGSGGKFQQVGLPVFNVMDYDLRVTQDEIFVRRANLRGPDDSILEVDGSVKLEPEVDADAHVKLSGYPLSEILQGDWKKRLEGRISGEVHVTGNPASDQGVAEGQIQVDGGVLQGLPILEKVARLTQTKRFLRMNLDQAKLEFKRKGDRLELSKVVVESRGLLKVTGECKIRGEKLDGNFRVGIVSSSNSLLAGVEKRVFTDAAEGYLWTDLRLTGTLSKPKEDLSKRLEEAAKDEAVNTALDVLEGLQEGSTDKAGDALNNGINLLNSLLGQ